MTATRVVARSPATKYGQTVAGTILSRGNSGGGDLGQVASTRSNRRDGESCEATASGSDRCGSARGAASNGCVASLRRRRSAPRSAPAKCPDTAHLSRRIGLFVVLCQLCRPLARRSPQSQADGDFCGIRARKFSEGISDVRGQISGGKSPKTAPFPRLASRDRDLRGTGFHAGADGVVPFHGNSSRPLCVSTVFLPTQEQWWQELIRS